MDDADLERRFGGLRRLYGPVAYERMRRARVAVVGVGGVGSWAAEALARCGVAQLVLIDLDQVSESNINRQVQALGSTVGQAKVVALRQRLLDIHPGCDVQAIEAFVEPDHWPALWPHALDGLIDACDQAAAKRHLALWALEHGLPFVGVGAAGGKQRPQAVRVDDLAHTTHDPLLSGLRQRLRKHHGAPRTGRMGLRCVFSEEPVLRASTPEGEACDPSAGLNCAGYGSSVMVTSTFGQCAAADVLLQIIQKPG